MERTRALAPQLVCWAVFGASVANGLHRGSCAVYCNSVPESQRGLEGARLEVVQDKPYACTDDLAKDACNSTAFEAIPRCPYNVRWQPSPCSEQCNHVDISYVDEARKVPNGAFQVSALACQSLCKVSPQCTYFTFVAEHRTCWLLGPNVRPMRRSGAVSGPRVCTFSDKAKSPPAVTLRESLKDFAAAHHINDLGSADENATATRPGLMNESRSALHPTGSNESITIGSIGGSMTFGSSSDRWWGDRIESMSEQFSPVYLIAALVIAGLTLVGLGVCCCFGARASMKQGQSRHFRSLHCKESQESAEEYDEEGPEDDEDMEEGADSKPLPESFKVEASPLLPEDQQSAWESSGSSFPRQAAMQPGPTMQHFGLQMPNLVTPVLPVVQPVWG